MSKTESERTLVGLRVTIYARGKRRIYVADFHYEGRHCRKTLQTTNKKVARERAITIEHNLANGTTILTKPVDERMTDINRISVIAAVEEFMTFLRTEGRRQKTVVKYEGVLRKFAAFAAESSISNLDTITLSLVDKYRARSQPHLGERSMHFEGSLMKRFFDWCVDRQLIANNPLANRKFKKPKAKPRGGPSLEQIDAILAASSRRRQPIIAVAAFAGIRISEILRLRVEDVDLQENWLHVVSRNGYETKTGDSWKVPIHPRLRKLLEGVQCEKAGRFFTALPSRKYAMGGHNVNPRDANANLHKILVKLGIPSGRDEGFTFHSLRSSFKTICVNSNIPREVVDFWQNHAPTRAASNLYYKLSDEDSQRFIRQAQFGP